MSTPKEQLRQIVETLPDDASWDDVRHAIFIRERIERGQCEMHQGKLIEQGEVEVRMKRWLDA